MKAEEFLKSHKTDVVRQQIPGQMSVQECREEAEKQPEEILYTSLTPSGIEVAYSPAPRRHYKVRKHILLHESTGAGGDIHPLSDPDWQEVPSVTTALGVLDKSGAIGWWSFRVGLSAIVTLWKQGIMPASPEAYEADQLEKLIVEHKLSPNHVKDKAADRGTSIHQAFETWAKSPDFRPNPEVYPENEQGYIVGLRKFLDDLGAVDDIEAEVMVGSIEHGFAGRYDLRLTIPTAREMVIKSYPVRKPKVAEVPAGKWLLDLKTSKDCFATHSLQLAAYELASVECGYGPTDYRAVVRVSCDGQYELRQANATAEEFLSVLSTHEVMQKKSWFS